MLWPPSLGAEVDRTEGERTYSAEVPSDCLPFVSCIARDRSVGEGEIVACRNGRPDSSDADACMQATRRGDIDTSGIGTREFHGTADALVVGGGFTQRECGTTKRIIRSRVAMALAAMALQPAATLADQLTAAKPDFSNNFGFPFIFDVSKMDAKASSRQDFSRCAARRWLDAATIPSDRHAVSGVELMIKNV